MVIEGALKEKLASLNFKPISRRTGRPLVGGPGPATAGVFTADTAPSAAGGGSGLGAMAPSSTERSTSGGANNLRSSLPPIRDGPAVRVAVRCRPPSNSSEPVADLASETAGEKVILRFNSTKEGDIPVAGVTSFRCDAYLGPDSTQEELFAQVAPIVRQIMEGSNASVLCHGITGAGKTYSMAGGLQEEPSSAGIVKRVSRRMFEYIRERSANGAVYMVEASYLQIFSPDGASEEIVDLLADAYDGKLEVKQDPQNEQSFVCENLRRVTIRTSDDVVEALSKGRQRSEAIQCSKGCVASRSHCIFVLATECLAEPAAAGLEPVVTRSKLMLVDLAGSESLLKAVPESSDDLARRQALGINRVLSNLASAIDGSATIGRSSALTSLLKDCLGGGARTLLVANIGPELRDLEETVKTLTFAQGLVVTSPVRNVEATSNPTDEDEISLLQMKKRHLECISKLKEKASDSREEELEDRRRIQQEMAEINNKLLTKDSAEQTMGEMRREQFGKIDEMKDQMTQAMREQLDQLRKTSYEDMETLRRHVEKSSLEAWKAKKETEEHEAKEVRLQAELQQARQAGRDAEAEASALKVRLATAEERRNMLQERQEELRKERIDFDEERKGLRHQGEQQWQRMTVVEAELQKFKSGAEVGSVELNRLNAARAEDNENSRQEREHWRARDVEMNSEIRNLQRQLDEAKKDHEVQELKAESERREAVGKLKMKLERLQGEASSRADQLNESQKQVASLEAERAMAQQREDAMRHQANLEIKRRQEELEDARAREAELMQMLHEVQDSIIVASGTGDLSPPTHSAHGSYDS